MTGCATDDHGPIPASWFATKRSFAELKVLAERGELKKADVNLEVADVLELGARVKVEIEGPMTGMCLWGLSACGPLPPMRWDCKKTDDGAVVSLYETDLLGEHEVFKVAAPSVDSAQDLTAIFWGRRRLGGR